MRLINCQTLELEEFFGPEFPQYAILSHTWDVDEVVFTDFRDRDPAARWKRGFQKIAYTCQQALQDEIKYAWVDTCCIDKSSSAELSEAINSMFKWYQRSEVCYVYLKDVLVHDLDRTFPVSRWFSRGWTLQELLAPEKVRFFDGQWSLIGDKRTHAEWISQITKIDADALCISGTHADGTKKGLGQFCVARRMSWASNRQTTRVEDRAYSLLGIFDINMSLLYGEGEKAFKRLQEEIIKNYADDSILAWGLNVDFHTPFPAQKNSVLAYSAHNVSALAKSPDDFARCHSVEYGAQSEAVFSMTNQGLQIQLPVASISYSTLARKAPHEVKPDSAVNGECLGLVGLLSCSAGPESALLAIFLGEDQAFEDHLRAQRCGVYPTGHTFLVDPAVAMRAASTQVIITDPSESAIIRKQKLGYRKIVLEESFLLKCMDYSISSAGILYSERPGSTKYQWDETLQLFSLPNMNGSDEMIGFKYEWNRPPTHHDFTVMMRGANVIAREGSSFSTIELGHLYDMLGKNAKVEEEEPIILIPFVGGSAKLVVSVNTKDVAFWRIYNVRLDAVEIKDP